MHPMWAYQPSAMHVEAHAPKWFCSHQLVFGFVMLCNHSERLIAVGVKVLSAEACFLLSTAAAEEPHINGLLLNQLKML